MRNIWPALALVSVLALGQAVTLKRTPKLGDVLKYRLTVVFSIFGNDIFYTSVDSQKIVGVDKDGSYTVESTQSDIEATNSGNPLPVEPSPHRSLSTYSPRGQVIRLEGEQSADAWRIADMSSFILPDKPISKGDTWTFTIPPNATLNSPGGVCTYTDEGPDPNKIDGFSVLRIAEDYQENIRFNQALSTGTVWIDPTDGTVVKVDEQWTAAPVLGIDTKLNGRVTYERIP